MKSKTNIKNVVALMTICIIFLSFIFVAIPMNKDNIAEATVPSATALINNGIYYIRNQRSGLYMDVNEEGTTNGTAIKQYTYTGNDNQRFKVKRINTNSVYELIPMHTNGMRVDVNGASTGNNASIQLYESNSGTAQRFKIITTGNGDNSFKILTNCSSYSKCLTVQNASYDSGANIIQYTYGNDGNQDNDHWYFEDVTLKERQNVILGNGQTASYQITIPDNKNYVVETIQKGNYIYDTELYVANTTNGTLYDDNSGTGNYSQICFNNQAGRDLTISVKFKNLTEGNVAICYLQIRKQQAVLYGGEYSDLDTTMDPFLPRVYLSSFYDSNAFINKSRSHFLEQDARGYARYNSEIMFFSGHGGSTSVKFSDSSYVYMYDITDMSNVRIAVWSSCKSALIDSASNSSMTHKSVAVGAQSSIGFNQTVYQISAYSFTGYLFEKLANGQTLSQAATYAANMLVFWDECRDYCIVGDDSTTITTPSYSKNNYEPSYSTNEYNEILNLLKTSKNYQSVDINSGTRYYLLINGCISNHFVDIIFGEHGQVVDVLGDVDELYSRYTPSHILPILIRKTTSERATHIETVYVDQNGIYIPVLIEHINCMTKDGYEYIDIVCTNLNDGSKIAYEDFAFRKS